MVGINEALVSHAEIPFGGVPTPPHPLIARTSTLGDISPPSELISRVFSTAARKLSALSKCVENRRAPLARERARKNQRAETLCGGGTSLAPTSLFHVV